MQLHYSVLPEIRLRIITWSFSVTTREETYYLSSQLISMLTLAVARRCATRNHVMQSNAIDQSETIITKHHGGDEFLGCCSVFGVLCAFLLLNIRILNNCWIFRRRIHGYVFLRSFVVQVGVFVCF